MGSLFWTLNDAYRWAAPMENGLRRLAFLDLSQKLILEGKLRASGIRFAYEFMGRCVYDDKRSPIPPLTMAEYRLFFVNGSQTNRSFELPLTSPKALKLNEDQYEEKLNRNHVKGIASSFHHGFKLTGFPKTSLINGWTEVAIIASDVLKCWPERRRAAAQAAEFRMTDAELIAWLKEKEASLGRRPYARLWAEYPQLRQRGVTKPRFERVLGEAFPAQTLGRPMKNVPEKMS